VTDGFSNPVVGGGGALIRESIHSPDYVTGVSGWSVMRDGSAEFNDLEFRGTFFGADVVINSGGAFFYNGTPAAGNLILAISGTGGNDPFGNPYLSGLMISGGNLLRMASGAHGDPMITTAVYGDAFARFVLNADGTINLGGGSSAADTNLYRPQTGQINTDGVLGVGGNIKVNAAVVKEIAGADATWQTPAYQPNWAGSTVFGTLTGLQTLHYRLGAEDKLTIGGCFAAGATAPGVAVLMLPLGYRPSAAYPVTVAKIAAGVTTISNCYISTAGNLNLNSQLGSSVTASAQYIIDPTDIPLGNLP
jgi:hypothetical protein